MTRCVGINKCKKEYLETSKAYCSGTSWMRSNTVLLKGQKKKKKNKKKEEKERKREEEQERHYQAQGNSSKSRIFTYRWMLVTQWKEERTNPPFPFSRRAKRQRRRNQIHLSLSSLAWPRHHTYRDQTSSGEILGQYLTRPAYLVKVRYETFGHHVTETFGADKMRNVKMGQPVIVSPSAQI